MGVTFYIAGKLEETDLRTILYLTAFLNHDLFFSEILFLKNGNSDETVDPTEERYPIDRIRRWMALPEKEFVDNRYHISLSSRR